MFRYTSASATSWPPGSPPLATNSICPKELSTFFHKFPGGDDKAFLDLLRQENILVVPGSGFGTPGYFRIAYCVDDAVIEGAMPGFSRAIGMMKSSKG